MCTPSRQAWCLSGPDGGLQYLRGPIIHDFSQQKVCGLPEEARPMSSPLHVRDQQSIQQQLSKQTSAFIPSCPEAVLHQQGQAFSSTMSSWQGLLPQIMFFLNAFVGSFMFLNLWAFLSKSCFLGTLRPALAEKRERERERPLTVLKMSMDVLSLLSGERTIDRCSNGGTLDEPCSAIKHCSLSMPDVMQIQLVEDEEWNFKAAVDPGTAALPLHSPSQWRVAILRSPRPRVGYAQANLRQYVSAISGASRKAERLVKMGRAQKCVRPQTCLQTRARVPKLLANHGWAWKRKWWIIDCGPKPRLGTEKSKTCLPPRAIPLSTVPGANTSWWMSISALPTLKSKRLSCASTVLNRSLAACSLKCWKTHTWTNCLPLAVCNWASSMTASAKRILATPKWPMQLGELIGCVTLAIVTPSHDIQQADESHAWKVVIPCAVVSSLRCFTFSAISSFNHLVGNTYTSGKRDLKRRRRL